MHTPFQWITFLWLKVVQDNWIKISNNSKCAKYWFKGLFNKGKQRLNHPDMVENLSLVSTIPCASRLLYTIPNLGTWCKILYKLLSQPSSNSKEQCPLLAIKSFGYTCIFKTIKKVFVAHFVVETKYLVRCTEQISK